MVLRKIGIGLMIVGVACDVICMGMVGGDFDFEYFHFVIMFGTISFLVGLALTIASRKYIAKEVSEQIQGSYKAEEVNDTVQKLREDLPVKDGWRCPRCKKVHPRYETSCVCGCTYEEYEIEKHRHAEELKKVELEKKAEEEKKVKEIFNYIEQRDDIEISTTENLIIRMLNKPDTKLSLSDMAKKLPRSYNASDFKESVNTLCEKGLITKGDDEKYSLIQIETTEESTDSNEENLSEVQPIQADIVEDKYEELRKIKALLDEGIITQEEFETKKKQLLGI